MKRFFAWTLFCLFSLLVITSCQKENIDTVIETEETITPTTTTITPPPPANALLGRASSESSTGAEAQGEGLNLDCIEIIFPFSLVDSEGATHEVASEEAFSALLSEEWDTTVYIVDFVYPISVSVNEEVSEITDSEQLGELFAECIPDGGWDEFIFPAYLIDDENSCYKTVYPISLADAADGTIITVADEAAFIEVLVEKEVYFHFPINLTDGEEVVSIANVDELFNTLFSCNEYYYEDSTAWDWEGGFEYIGCFQVNFPMTVVVADGGEKVVNNHEELCELMLQGELVDYAYPLTLTGLEGEEVTVNSGEELDSLLEQCYEGPWNPGGGQESDLFLLALFSQPFGEDSTAVCFTIHYPISGTYVDTEGVTQTIVFNNVEEIFQLEIPEVVDLVYPVNITSQSGDQVISINNIEEIFEVLEACEDGL